MSDEHLSAEDLAEYWTTDASGDSIDVIETHVFACADCARRLASTRALVDGVRDDVRRGRVQAIVTDAVLNRLARDGTRMRTFTVEPNTVVPCAVWDGDEAIVTRMRADFTGLTHVSLVMQVAGEEADRVADVPVAPAAREVIGLLPAEHLRHLPRVDVRLQLFGSREGAGEALVAEYILEHGGTLERR